MSDNYFEEYRKELDKLNLKTTEDLENLVKPLIKEATKITLKKSSVIPLNSHLISQFNGQPYFEKEEKWPVAKNGNELDFVFQIFNKQGLELPKNIKLIQFYYDFEEDSYNEEDGGWFVKIYENINPDNFLFIKKPDEWRSKYYCEIEYEQIKSLPDWEGIDTYCSNASNLSCVLDENEPWKNYGDIADKLAGELNLGSQLGGYPSWIQGDQSPDKNDFTLLFQLDSEGDAGLMWVDCGMIYIFYNEMTKEIKYFMQFH